MLKEKEGEGYVKRKKIQGNRKHYLTVHPEVKERFKKMKFFDFDEDTKKKFLYYLFILEQSNQKVSLLDAGGLAMNADLNVKLEEGVDFLELVFFLHILGLVNVNISVTKYGTKMITDDFLKRLKKELIKKEKRKIKKRKN